MIPENVSQTYSHLYLMLYNESDEMNFWSNDNADNNNNNTVHSLLRMASAILVSVCIISLSPNNNHIYSTEAQRELGNLPQVIKVKRMALGLNTGNLTPQIIPNHHAIVVSN